MAEIRRDGEIKVISSRVKSTSFPSSTQEGRERGREGGMGEAAPPHICTLCHTGKCRNCLCPSDCLQICLRISWISLKMFFSFPWRSLAIMCSEGFFSFFQKFKNTDQHPPGCVADAAFLELFGKKHHEDLVSASLLTPITAPAAPPGPPLL